MGEEGRLAVRAGGEMDGGMIKQEMVSSLMHATHRLSSMYRRDAYNNTMYSVDKRQALQDERLEVI